MNSKFEKLSATLPVFARTGRPQLLRAYATPPLPVIAESLDGVPALAETACAIVDTAKW